MKTRPTCDAKQLRTLRRLLRAGGIAAAAFAFQVAFQDQDHACLGSVIGFGFFGIMEIAGYRLRALASRLSNLEGR